MRGQYKRVWVTTDLIINDCILKIIHDFRHSLDVPAVFGVANRLDTSK